MNPEIQQQLEKLAYQRTIPFCYGCYKEAPTGRCTTCYSDDLMRLLPGVGCEYGTEWVIEHILKEELTPVDLDEAFEQPIRECYRETVNVGWLEVDTVDTIKAMDPVSWDLAVSEWADAEEQDGNIISADNGMNYYWVSDVECLLECLSTSE